MVLDDETTLHDIDDPALARHLERAAAGFRDKSLKREYFVTLEEGGSVGRDDQCVPHLVPA